MKIQNVILKIIIGPKSGTAMAVPAVPPTTALLLIECTTSYRIYLFFIEYTTSYRIYHFLQNIQLLIEYATSYRIYDFLQNIQAFGSARDTPVSSRRKNRRYFTDVSTSRSNCLHTQFTPTQDVQLNTQLLLSSIIYTRPNIIESMETT